ncbi:MAG: tyrosine-type recombinase/integrase [Pseudomonas sp.]
MFDQLFKRATTVARHTEAPLYSERVRYLEHLQDHQVARKTLVRCAAYMLCIGAEFRWRLPDSVASARINVMANRWGARHVANPTRTDGQASRTVFVSTATNWLRFIGKLQAPVVKQPGTLQIEAYARFMRDELNLSAVTIHTRYGRAAEFLRLADAQGRDVAQLDWETIDLILALKGRRDGLTRASMQTYGYDLRSFLRYLQERGQCQPGLAETIRPPRIYQGETLPAGPSWEQVHLLLDGLQGERPSAIRDLAIMLLFAFYGLRVAEVRRLCLEDLDWERAIVRVHRTKQSPRVEFYPLTGDMADALVRYLRSVRPTTDRREVFLQLRAPYQPVSSSALWQVVNRRLRPMGLAIKHNGPHALRHACATRMLAQGLTMKEIGDFLGHSHPATTAMYAKVDIDGLRRVADVDLGRFL